MKEKGKRKKGIGTFHANLTLKINQYFTEGSYSKKDATGKQGEG